MTYRSRLQALTLDWDAEQHPRDDAGRFSGDGGGSGSGDDGDGKDHPSKDQPATEIPAGKKGECFRNTMDFVREHDDFDVVHGKVTNGEGRTFDHAWAESDKEVADPTTGVQMDKDRWYGLVKAQPEAKYSAEHAMINAVRTRNLGPWTAEEVGHRKKALSYRERLPFLLAEAMQYALDWDESQHPRDDGGKFTEGGVPVAQVKERLSAYAQEQIAAGEWPPDGLSPEETTKFYEERAKRRYKPKILSSEDQKVIVGKLAALPDATTVGSTRFLLPDGRRVTGGGEHSDIAFEAGTNIYDAMQSGVIRFTNFASGAKGMEVAGPITTAQARAMYDAQADEPGNEIHVDLVDISRGHDVKATKRFDPERSAPAALRRWVNGHYDGTIPFPETLTALTARERFAIELDWDEGQHPRDESGKFTGDGASEPRIAREVLTRGFHHETFASVATKNAAVRAVKARLEDDGFEAEPIEAKPGLVFRPFFDPVKSRAALITESSKALPNGRYRVATKVWLVARTHKIAASAVLAWRHDLYSEDQPRDAGGRFATGSGGGGGAKIAKTESPQFKAWFKESAVVDDDGEPLTVYHGTTHDIEQFRAAGAEGLNPESDWGAGVYFTSDPEDASENYAGEGPDLTSRLESRADEIESEMADGGGIGKTYVTKVDEHGNEYSVLEEGDRRAAAMAQARKELAGPAPSVIPAYLSMQKPVVLGKPNGSSSAKETHFTMEYEYDDPDDPDSDIIGEKGTLPELLSALREEASQYDDNFRTGSRAVEKLAEQLSGEDYVSASKIAEVWQRAAFEIEDPNTGRLISKEVLRAGLQRAGYDGIIDRTVDAKFGSSRRTGKSMTGITPDTTHFIAFTPTQIKSAVGNVAFDPANPSLVLRHDLDWDEAQHPRDEAGKFAGGEALSGHTPEEKAAHEEEYRKLKENEESRTYGEQQTKVAVQTVADRQGFDPAQIDVVNKEPREFEVAGRKLQEGGHYDPKTGRIQVNAATLPSGRAGFDMMENAVRGLVAHEIMHAQHDTVEKAAQAEHDDIRETFKTYKYQASDEVSEFDRLFKKNGFPRDNRIAEITARWPASAAMAKTAPNGDSYLGSWSEYEPGKWAFDEVAYGAQGKPGRAEQMEKEDGFTSYSRLYWDAVKTAAGPAAVAVARRRAEQETLAEVAAYHEAAPRGPWKGDVPSPSWQRYGREMAKVYGKVKK